jgi:Rrf2 family protein
MAANSRFAVGVHCMLSLAALGEEGSTAEFLAGSIHTNPVVVRRILKSFEKAGYVEIRPGKGGGVRLRRAPEDLTLAQILKAVEPQTEFFAYHAAEPNPQCRVSCEIRNLLQPVFQRVDQVVHDALAETRLSDLLHRLRS